MLLNHKKFIRLALNEARKSLEEGQWPVGVVLVLDGKVIATGRRTRGGDYCLDHAEMVALRGIPAECRGRMGELVVYTTLEPCAMCFGAVLAAKIGKIVFALEDPYSGFCHLAPESAPPRYRTNFPQSTGGILREEARQLFREFLQTTDLEYWRDNKDNPLVKICME